MAKHGAYSGYIDLKYRPKKEDLICEFYVEPEKGFTIKQAGSHVAAESSVGTWTKVSTMTKRIEKMKAKVFEIKGHCIKVAYPAELFELNNIPEITSSIAGNVFGMNTIKHLRLEDVNFPDSMINANKGPRYGIQGVRKILGVKKRPLVGTIVKPKLGLKTKEHAKVAYNAWIGGCDVVKDDENLSSQKFNPFENRVIKTLEMRDLAESETGEKKGYMANVTAESNKMIDRADFIKDHGGKYAMIDIVTCGWSALQTLREHGPKLIIHGHRAMHAAMTRDKKHGISMMVLADFSRLIGVDQLHIGTIVGKMEGTRSEVTNLYQEIEKKFIKPHGHVLTENWGKIKPVFAVCSGGLHPGNIPKLMEYLGKDIIIQAGGGIHGNPLGTAEGSSAMRDAVDSVMKGIPFKQAIKESVGLTAAAGKWNF